MRKRRRRTSVACARQVDVRRKSIRLVKSADKDDVKDIDWKKSENPYVFFNFININYYFKHYYL